MKHLTKWLEHVSMDKARFERKRTLIAIPIFAARDFVFNGILKPFLIVSLGTIFDLYLLHTQRARPPAKCSQNGSKSER